ncbi:MAG: hypothetical protein J0L64_23645 [Acidobacteria bacterium]|nr:hypothetical protein [Acidobacteriota bacterium]
MFRSLIAAFTDALSRWEVLALQFVGNVVLLALVWLWLGLGVGSALAVVMLVALALVLFALSALLHGSGLAAFRPMRLGEALASTRARLPKLALYSMVAVALLLAWDVAGAYSAEATQWAASALTFSSQSPTKPASLEGAYTWFLRSAFLLIALALHPIAARLAGSIDSAASVWKRPGYWVAGVVLAVLGLLVPWWLIKWVPAFSSMAMETLSMLVRFGIAYVLATVSWTTMAALLPRLAAAPLPATGPLPEDDKTR